MYMCRVGATSLGLSPSDTSKQTLPIVPSGLSEWRWSVCTIECIQCTDHQEVIVLSAWVTVLQLKFLTPCYTTVRAEPPHSLFSTIPGVDVASVCSGCGTRVSHVLNLLLAAGRVGQWY